jgi:hypothetical protein
MSQENNYNRNSTSIGTSGSSLLSSFRSTFGRRSISTSSETQSITASSTSPNSNKILEIITEENKASECSKEEALQTRTRL